MRILTTLLLFFIQFTVNAQGIEDIVSTVKPSVVGVGIYDPLASPRHQLHGTGFAVGDGSIIATNFHVVEKGLSPDSNQKRVVFIGVGPKPDIQEATLIKSDPVHDLAILKINKKLAPMSLAESNSLRDGKEIAFTGFPIGAVLGLYPATHKGIVAATTPIVRPSANAQQLSLAVLKRLKKPFFVYQLDATAYPGNSGSPVYDTSNGDVVAIINKVFVKRSKESVLADPSGITYAIPVRFLRDLISDSGL